MADKKSEQTHCSLDHACQLVFGGIGALNEGLYECLVADVAKMCGRENDSKFKVDIQEALNKLPCPMD